MADMYHRIRIDAPAVKVYDALTTEAGLRSWWTGDCSAQPKLGSIAVFGFSNRATVFRMRIDELIPGKRVVWTCIGDVDEWNGTRLTWEISQDEKATDLLFTHAYWRSTEGPFRLCNSTWGALMFRLRDSLEGKNPCPLFRGIV